MSAKDTTRVEEEEEQTQQECCICYDEIGKTNVTTTPCGHTFCFRCIVKCLETNNKCPYCREVLREEVEEEEEEEGDEDEDEYTYASEDEDDNSLFEPNWQNTSNPVSALVSVKEVEEILIKEGITMENMLCICLSRYDGNMDHKHIDKIHRKLAAIVIAKDDEKKKEWEERQMLMEEDTRRNAARSPSPSLLDKSGDDAVLNIFDKVYVRPRLSLIHPDDLLDK